MDGTIDHFFQNFVVFMVVFLLVIIGFTVSFKNLYWYYDEETRIAAETPLHESSAAEDYYGT